VERIGILVDEFLDRFIVARRGLSTSVETEKGTPFLGRFEDMVLRVQQDTLRQWTYKKAV
jgi:hypothetical protein